MIDRDHRLSVSRQCQVLGLPRSTAYYQPVRDAKGNRDRLVPLPHATLLMLRRFWQTHRHPELLFPNRHGGVRGAAQATSPLDRGGVQKTLRQVATECGLKKRSPRTACATATPRT